MNELNFNNTEANTANLGLKCVYRLSCFSWASFHFFVSQFRSLCGGFIEQPSTINWSRVRVNEKENVYTDICPINLVVRNLVPSDVFAPLMFLGWWFFFYCCLCLRVDSSFPGLLIHLSENLAVVCTNLGHVYFKYGPCFPSVWSQSDSSHVFLLLSLKNQFVLVCLNGTEFSRLQNQEWRTKGGHRVIACLSASLCWFPEFCPPKRETETFSKSNAERERDPNAESKVVWTWIESWFPAQSACGFQSPWHTISPLSTSWNPP